MDFIPETVGYTETKLLYQMESEERKKWTRFQQRYLNQL